MIFQWNLKDIELLQLVKRLSVTVAELPEFQFQNLLLLLVIRPFMVVAVLPILQSPNLSQI